MQTIVPFQHKIGKHMDQMVGQSIIKNRFAMWLSAYSKGASMPAVLFEGPKGHGKSDFAALVAKEIEEIHIAFKRPKAEGIEVDGTEFGTPTQFVHDFLGGLEGKTGLIHIDECHNLKPEIQEALLRIYGDKKNSIVTITYAGKEVSVNKKELSFVFSTTNPEKMRPAFYNRLTTVAFDRYNYTQLAEIVRRATPKNLTIEKSVLDSVAKNSRMSPRICMDVVADLERFALDRNIKVLEQKHWEDYCSLMGVNPHGLSQTEMNMLKFLKENGKSRNHIIASGLSLAPETIQKQTQIFPIEIGLIEFTQSGERVITQKGLDALK